MVGLSWNAPGINVRDTYSGLLDVFKNLLLLAFVFGKNEYEDENERA